MFGHDLPRAVAAARAGVRAGGGASARTESAVVAELQGVTAEREHLEVLVPTASRCTSGRGAPRQRGAGKHGLRRLWRGPAAGRGASASTRALMSVLRAQRRGGGGGQAHAQEYAQPLSGIRLIRGV